jgi:hypothetical protein
MSGIGKWEARRCGEAKRGMKCTSILLRGGGWNCFAREHRHRTRTRSTDPTLIIASPMRNCAAARSLIPVTGRNALRIRPDCVCMSFAVSAFLRLCDSAILVLGAGAGAGTEQLAQEDTEYEYCRKHSYDGASHCCALDVLAPITCERVKCQLSAAQVLAWLLHRGRRTGVIVGDVT